MKTKNIPETSMSLIRVPLEKLVSNRVQPPSRADDSKTRRLMVSLQADGQDDPIAIRTQGEKYVILNGHRRVSALRLLGETHAWALVKETRRSDALAWAIPNLQVKVVDSAEAFTAWARAKTHEREGVLANMTAVTRGHILRCVEIFGLTRAEQMAAEGISPSVSKIALSTQNLLIKYLDEEPPSLREIGEWLLKHRAQSFMSHAFPTVADSSKVAWRRLSRRIQQDRPFPRAEWFPSKAA